ncbi:LPS-assembly protein LptD [Henriciella litoralis]|uniref:LPS-assembly protein LptD n=1 Tax=Henriciella litoralis TaxID=568102 RepID=UPI0009FF777A|nr:LPS assembly protein LptD [Henriciella litoralis]
MSVWKTTIATALVGTFLPVAAAQGDDTSAAVATRAAAEDRVVLTADNAYVLDDENTVVAEGNVMVEYEGRVLTADSLTYNRNTARVRARGNVTILEPDGTQRFAEEVETDADLTNGYAVNFSLRTPDGDTAAANSAVRSNDTYNALDRAIFTSCELCEGESTPTWAIRARKAVLNDESGMYSYRDAVFELAGIPIFYLPWFAHPDPKAERRSGFLIPTVGSSSKTGLNYKQPYIWSISPYQDLVIAPTLYSKVNPLVELDYRKRFYSGDVNANISFTNEKLFDSDGEKFGESEWRGHVFADGKFAINENWLWGFGIEETSDDLYIKRYDIQGENNDRGLYVNQPRVLLTQLYTQGQSTNWYADGSVLTFDNLRLTGSREDAIADVLPLAHLRYDFDLGAFGYADVRASAAYLDRGTGTDSQRTSIGANWTAQKVLPGGILAEPFAEARFDYYDFNDFPTAGDSDTVERTVGNVGARLSMPFYRPGKTVDILLEPIVMASVGTSSPNDDPLPNEDSNYFELNQTSLFEPNGASGYDLYEGDDKLAVGLSATARWKNGLELYAKGGRRWRSVSDNAFTEPTNLDGTVSDWVAELGLDMGRVFDASAQVRLDDDTLDVNRIDTKLTLNLDRVRADIGYYMLTEDVTVSGQRQEGVILQSEVEVTDNYFVIYNLSRDIEQNRDIRQSLGFGYQDDCSRFEILYERSEKRDRELGPSDSIVFRFALKTIGKFGSKDFD